MAERGTVITGEEPSPREIEEVEALKVDIVEQLRAADVRFPIENMDRMRTIYPPGTPKTCKYLGKNVSIHDLINNLSDRDFPIKTPGDAAIALTRGCEITSADVTDINRLKKDIVDQLRAARVGFPIRDKAELASVYPYGTKKSCMYKGNQVSIHDLVKELSDGEFPLRNAEDAARVLTEKCDRPVK